MSMSETLKQKSYIEDRIDMIIPDKYWEDICYRWELNPLRVKVVDMLLGYRDEFVIKGIEKLEKENK